MIELAAPLAELQEKAIYLSVRPLQNSGEDRIVALLATPVETCKYLGNIKSCL